MAKRKKAKKAGRPTKYRKEYGEQVYKLCLLGATDAQLADFFGVAESTITLWKRKHMGFSASIKKGKIQADAEVAASLYHRARGYEHPETKVFCNDGKITTHEVVKHYPPDTAAAFIWLKNRAGWKDRCEVGTRDEPPQPVTVEELRQALEEAESLHREASRIQAQVNATVG